MTNNLKELASRAIADAKKEIQEQDLQTQKEKAPMSKAPANVASDNATPADNKYMDTFCRIPFVNDLSNEECDRLAQIVTLMQLAKGDVLIEQGKKDDSLYVLIEGRLQVNRSTVGQGYVTLACIREGEMAGEMGFLDDSEHSATLMADDDSKILRIHRKDLEGMLNEHPQTVYKLMRAIAREVHKITQRMNMQFVEMSNYIHHQQGRY